MDQKRNYGIDLLRIVATAMIIILHILGVGGVIYTIDPSSPIYVVAWLLEFLSYCAVNCYALISGYVGINKKFRLASILQLWIQVVFTTILITFLFIMSGMQVSAVDIFKLCMPITFRTYWYFTAYFGLFFLMPFLNQLIEVLERNTAMRLIGIMLILFSVMPTFLRSDMFYINSGYSVSWLVVMYLIGGILRKHYENVYISKKILFVIYIGSVLFTLCTKLGLECLSGMIPFTIYESNFLMNYNSPTMVAAGVSLFLLFREMRVTRKQKIISLFAPLTFGIYIIHTHPLVWDYILAGRFTGFTQLNPCMFVSAVFLTMGVIFAICTVFEMFRVKVFKLLCVQKFTGWIEGKLKSY